jgi:peptidoglycan/LPS O-acetylase OafA/YrhL
LVNNTLEKILINKRLPQVDFLRGLAAFAVFIFHVTMAIGFDKRVLPPISAFGTVWKNIPAIFSFGASGVSLFFVVSGFCLSLKVLRAGSDSLDYSKYLLERFTRLYPAYFVAVLFSFAVATSLGHAWSLPEAASLLVFFQGFIQTWHFSVNGALWSMATEVQFYLVFPFVFVLFIKRPQTTIIAILTATVMFRLWAAHAPFAADLSGGINTGTFLMNMLPGRLWEFVLGIFVAHAWLKNNHSFVKVSRLLLLPLIVVGVLARMKLPTWIADPALGLMCAAFVGAMLGSTRFTADGIGASFGRMSYSFFLIHVPVISFVVARMGPYSGSSLYEVFFLVSLVAFIITFIFSALLYKYIEVGCANYLRKRAASWVRLFGKKLRS